MKIAEFKVTTGAEVLTWQVLKTGLHTRACLGGWICVGMVVTFPTLTGGTATALTERLAKTTLNNLQGTLTAHLLKWVTEALQTAWFTETWTHSFLAPREL